MVAYDFETSRIEPGTPRPLWLTAYGDELQLETYIKDLPRLGLILVRYFLTPELQGVKFVAWYGNGFDAYFVACALVTNPDYVLRPYLTQSNSLRGLRVIRAQDVNNPKAKGWEFLDGQAMLGLPGVPLSRFLANFAPDFGKLTGVIDFEREEFNPRNKLHREYAMRDSEGLYHGMVNAQRILMERFGEPIAVTMGGACIRIFKANIPEGVNIATPRDAVLTLVRDYVMRGGFCYCARRYTGPVWKYDLNQAYAAAMREALLPCGFTTYVQGPPPEGSPVYIAELTATKPGNVIPFYYRTELHGRLCSSFSAERIERTWLTSIEVDQLRAEGWAVNITQAYTWDESFSMADYVNGLEQARMTCEGGPNGPIGTMIKGVGNHSYGKTLEALGDVEYIMGPVCPDGWAPFYGDATEPLEFVYYRFIDPDDVRPKDYHQPQLGAFITAHVRMVVRRAALLNPGAWLYADTDCVVFCEDVTDRLDIHPSRYGAWKVEERGTRYKMIAKKVYTQDASPEVRAAWATMTPEQRGKAVKRSAKGLNVKKLTPEDFDAWAEGMPPVQQQTQRNNFLAVLRGVEMYRAQERAGTAVEGQVHPSKNRVS